MQAWLLSHVCLRDLCWERDGEEQQGVWICSADHPYVFWGSLVTAWFAYVSAAHL